MILNRIGYTWVGINSKLNEDTLPITILYHTFTPMLQLCHSALRYELAFSSKLNWKPEIKTLKAHFQMSRKPLKRWPCDLVTQSLTEGTLQATLQSNLIDFKPLRHVIRVMRRHDLCICRSNHAVLIQSYYQVFIFWSENFLRTNSLTLDKIWLNAVSKTK